MRCDGTRWDAMRCDVMDGLRLFVCIHTYVHTYIGKIHAYMHAYIHACTHVYIHTYKLYARTHARTRMLQGAVLRWSFLMSKSARWSRQWAFHPILFIPWMWLGSSCSLKTWTSWCDKSRCLFCRESDGPGMQSVHHLEWSEWNYSDRGVIRFGRNELV